MPTLLQVDEMPLGHGIEVPRQFYTVLRHPALLAGMREPSDKTSWDEIGKTGFCHVVCFKEYTGYDPYPLSLTCIGPLEDLYHRKPPKDPAHEERLIRDAERFVSGKMAAGESVVIHCEGGTGRTGTVIGCTLRVLGFDGPTVITYLRDLNHLHRSPSKWPESDWQRELVLRYPD